MAFDKFRQSRDTPEVDLIPVMNLFVVLIPFLLLSAAFYHVGVIPTSLPSQGATSGEEAPPPNLKQVTVNLLVEQQRLVLTASNEGLSSEQLEQLAMEIPSADTGHDLDTLTTALSQIKSMYDESDTVVLLPGEGVLYRDVVQILDAARELVETDASGERRTPLFPVVVLSKKV